MNNKQETNWGGIICMLLLGALFIVFAIDAKHNKQIEEEYGKEIYEFVILEKREPIGSNFHLIGGRSSETEYHIVFRTRCTNRPNNENKSKWETHDEEVDYLTYRYYEVGKTYKFYTTTGYFIPKQR